MINQCVPVRLSIQCTYTRTHKHTHTHHNMEWNASREGEAQLVHSDLLVGHPVDDAVIARVHVPQVVGDDDNGQSQSDH